MFDARKYLLILLLPAIMLANIATNAQANSQFQFKSKYGKGCPLEGWIKSSQSIFPATAVFTNGTSSPLELYWLDFQGQAQLHSKIQPGKNIAVKTYHTHNWFAKDPHQGACVGSVFTVNANDFWRTFTDKKAKPAAKTNSGSTSNAGTKQAKDINMKYLCPVDDVAKSPISNSKSTLTFRNNTWAPVSVYWLNYKGKSQKFMTIQAGQSASISSFIGHFWYAKDSQGKCYGRLRKVTTSNQTFEISY